MLCIARREAKHYAVVELSDLIPEMNPSSRLDQYHGDPSHGVCWGSSRLWYLRLLDSLWLGRALLALFVTFALTSIVPRLQMRTCVATHVALHAKCAVASLKGTSECCGVSHVNQ
jgi:hypothetical protein